MTRSWAEDLEGTGVHINLLAPGGATATGMVPDDVPATVSLLSPEIVVAPALHLAVADSSGQRILGTEWRPLA
jgi:NAD(P)-dependent dehydrogenase (short-subunit alcohol dehydrogenase family)